MNALRIITKLKTRSANLLEAAKFSTVALKSTALDPVDMSFASYESTLPVDGTPPLIIMHGLFGSKANWNSLSKVFHKQTARKIIAVDARNHGDSPHCPKHSYPHLAEDVRALLSHQKITRASLLGHSMGGRTMMYFALKYPEMVEKLIVADVSPISTSPNLESTPTIFSAMQKIIFPSNVPMSSARQAADSQLSKSVNDKGLRAFLLTNLVQRADGSFTWRINIEALLTNYAEHLARFPEVPNLQYTGPVLFVAGGVSDFIQKSDHPHILKLFPQAEFKEIEGAGHLLHSEKPTEFLEICTEFLKREATQN